jgi:hypothetical protein
MHSETLWLPGGSFQPLRYHPGGIGNWSGHLPFAHDLVKALRPELLVELGTHYGESYFGFCQSIAENNVACSCYAVDTWVGELHAGTYDESVFNEVSAYNAALYSRFSYLLRTTFDAAVSNFADESIDVLHIDGLHTYDAVSHDFHIWHPKVKPGGIILLHDTSARHGDFGVWKFWNELKCLGSCFAFTHSWGLGVYRKPGNPSAAGGPLLEALFDSCNAYKEHIRNFYSLCALKLEQQHYSKTGVRIAAQAFPYGLDGYSAETAINSDVVSDTWQQLAIEIGPGIGNGPLRLDPSDRPGLIDIASIALRSPSGDETYWSAASTEISSLSTGGTLMRLKGAEDLGFCRFLSFGPDPQLFLPSLNGEHSHRAVLLEVKLRIQTQFSSLLPLLNERSAIPVENTAEKALVESADYDLLRHERDDLLDLHGRLSQQQETLTLERNSLIQERDSLLATLRKQQGELYVAKTDLKRQVAATQELQSRLAELDRQLSAAKSEFDESQTKVAELEQILKGVLASRSWRITAPMRDLIAAIRPGRA